MLLLVSCSLCFQRLGLNSASPASSLRAAHTSLMHGTRAPALHMSAAATAAAAAAAAAAEEHAIKQTVEGGVIGASPLDTFLGAASANPFIAALVIAGVVGLVSVILRSFGEASEYETTRRETDKQVKDEQTKLQEYAKSKLFAITIDTLTTNVLWAGVGYTGVTTLTGQVVAPAPPQDILLFFCVVVVFSLVAAQAKATADQIDARIKETADLLATKKKVLEQTYNQAERFGLLLLIFCVPIIQEALGGVLGGNL